MAYIDESYEDDLKYCANKWAELLKPDFEKDIKLIQKGLFLFRQEQVYELRLENNFIFASVQDVMPVKVKINLNDPEMSECSCPADYYCRHQLAVFFAAYNQFNSVTNWVEEWRKPLKLKIISTKVGLKKAKDLVKSVGVLKPDYDQWIETFSQSFKTIVQETKYKNPYTIIELFNIYLRQIKASAPPLQEVKNLYELISLVISFNKLSKFIEQAHFSEEQINLYFQPIFRNLIELAEAAIQKLNVQYLPFSFDIFIKKLCTDTEKLLVISPNTDTEASILQYHRTIFFSILWEELFSKKNWQDRELVRLNKQIEMTKYYPIQHSMYITGYIHLLFVAKKDKELFERLKYFDLPLPYILNWVVSLLKKQQWNRVTPYIEILVNRSGDYLNLLDQEDACKEFSDFVIEQMNIYCTACERIDLFEKTLLHLLPYSFEACEEFYYERKDFDRWIELMIYFRMNVSEISPQQLKTVEKHDPLILLSLYHQSTQSHIDMKNRENYKEAVQQLKKLKSLYSKIGKKEEWTSFLYILKKRTKRLRAFQEECEKEKLYYIEKGEGVNDKGK
ncbi:SWIM zinc finger family protein [Bacillus aquiflavi]|uniref:SWIM zinc finger family protein n=1 Tax=Bacillus aquiflavi TaxID=2672567 RepID=A0A6B3VZK8_9BACI|nr:SWIM zinc finger family protein [Bacillus aquiflavi]MBA4536673.1 SWIM zinc finger family protein [Bacillus aquiflavi]NEY81041.1 SWIM zinc finger family protein [Bacillus aquiflavi]UAC47888.1 SWIM zinc finger family protein [Bacillus aquiflavi]